MSICIDNNDLMIRIYFFNLYSTISIMIWSVMVCFIISTSLSSTTWGILLFSWMAIVCVLWANYVPFLMAGTLVKIMVLISLKDMFVS